MDLFKGNKMKESFCGNSECSVSTNVIGQLTFGRGILDDNGCWSIPCRICAKHHDDTIEQTKISVQEDLIERGYNSQEIKEYIEKSEWINFPAWPTE